MRPDPEKELDAFINALNEERRPEAPATAEVQGLMRTVRSVKSLKEPTSPSPDFESRLLKGLQQQPPKPQGRLRRTWWAAASLAAAAVLLMVVVVPSMTRRDVAMAMAAAIQQVERYHGVLEKSWASAAGQTQVVWTQEIWVDGDRYAVQMQDGTTTVNDGQHKWQVRPQDQVVALLPVAPDTQRVGLDLKAVGEDARQYPHRVVGHDTVAGRPAAVLEITPPGGDPYRVWVDAETNLPVRMVTAWQNALQTTYTYTELEINQPVDTAHFAFTVPDGFTVVETDPGQQVNGLAEAAEAVGFVPAIPAEPPVRMIAYQDRLVLEYGQTTVEERRAEGDFRPATYGALGTAGGGTLEVLAESLRWRQGDLEITVTGPEAEAVARSIAPDLEMPDPDAGFPQEPAVAVEVDMTVEENNQRQVDGGHSPYLLDPIMVAMSFLGSQGIAGDMDAFAVSFSSGTHAVVEVPAGPISRVYVQRLVRQNETGIWTVVGYDPR